MNTYTLHRSLLDTGTATGTTTATNTADGVHVRTSLPPKVHPNTLPNVLDIIYRVILLWTFATVALWANHEASKGFSITIVNDAGKYSSPGKRFSLFYESNDRATRIVLNTSRFVENLLYPNDHHGLQHTKKQINSVTLRLAPVNLTPMVAVYTQEPRNYVIMLSPSLMEKTSHNNDAFVLSVLQGMARVWLWNGNGATPHVLLNGMVEYISTLAGFRSTQEWNSGAGDVPVPVPEKGEICWKDKDPRKVAGFLKFYDQRPQPHGGGGGGDDGGGAVIRRLNKGMINGWNDVMMDDALGMTGHHACGSYDILTTHHNPSSSI